MRAPLIFLFLVAVTVLASAAGASFTLAPHQTSIEGQALDRDALFARIDSLEAALEAEPDTPELLDRLGQLYLATDLMKHRRHALDLLERALSLDASRFETARLRAVTAQRMRYTRDAQGWIETLTERFATDPRSHALQARFQFIEGRRRMIESRFEASRAAWRACLAVDSMQVEAWYGLAATCLALADYAGAREAAAQLVQRGDASARSLFVEAAALAGSGEGEVSESRFEEALASCADSVRAVFREAKGFLGIADLAAFAPRALDRSVAEQRMRVIDEDFGVLDDVDWRRLVAEDEVSRQAVLGLFWREFDNHPTRLYNPGELRYWRRLVEADILFGDPEGGRRGWETSMGQAYVRWGRPTSTYYTSGTGGGILGELDTYGVRLPIGEDIPQSTPLWFWTWKRPGRWFSLMFTDATYNSRWSIGGASAFRMEGLRKQQPLSFDDDADTNPPPFRLATRTAVFPRGDDILLETWISVRPEQPFSGLAEEDERSDAARAEVDSVAVEWALFDAEGERIDYRREILRDANRRSVLHRRCGAPATNLESDPFLLSIGARLVPGAYRVAVEAVAIGSESGLARVMQIEVQDPGPPSLLAISDLQLASAMRPYVAGSGIDPRLVKFGAVVLPVPDLRVPVDATEIALYFEARHLATDAEGRTQFDVRYEVLSSTREVRNLTRAESFLRADLERVDPLTLEFLEEQTGVSREGVVVKGTPIDVSGLASGDYVLVVTLFDRLAKREVSAALPFRKRGS